MKQKQSEEEQMLLFAPGVIQDAKRVARQMLEQGETSTVYPQGGRPLFHMARDQRDLEQALMSFEIDGVEIFVGASFRLVA